MFDNLIEKTEPTANFEEDDFDNRNENWQKSSEQGSFSVKNVTKSSERGLFSVENSSVMPKSFHYECQNCHSFISLSERTWLTSVVNYFSLF